MQIKCSLLQVMQAHFARTKGFWVRRGDFDLVDSQCQEMHYTVSGIEPPMSSFWLFRFGSATVLCRVLTQINETWR